MKVLGKIFYKVSVLLTIIFIAIGVIKFIQLSHQATINALEVEYTHEDCYQYYINHRDQF